MDLKSITIIYHKEKILAQDGAQGPGLIHKSSF